MDAAEAGRSLPSYISGFLQNTFIFNYVLQTPKMYRSCPSTAIKVGQRSLRTDNIKIIVSFLHFFTQNYLNDRGNIGAYCYKNL